jgi:ABC-2 type transport system permease protein
MLTVFKKELRLSLRTLGLWSAIMFLAAAFAGIEFGALAGQIAAMQAQVAQFPRLVAVMFGWAGLDLTSPAGLYACLPDWYCLVAYAYAITFGAYAVARDERFGTAEFLYTKPLSRGAILAAKALAAAVGLALIAAVTLVGSAVFLVPVAGPGIVGPAAAGAAGMLATMLVLASIGFLCAAASKHHKTGSRAAIAALVAFYAIYFAICYFGAGAAGRLTPFSPVAYFSPQALQRGGFDARLAALAAGIAAGAFALAARRYRDKELLTP